MAKGVYERRILHRMAKGKFQMFQIACLVDKTQNFRFFFFHNVISGGSDAFAIVLEKFKKILTLKKKFFFFAENLYPG